MPIVMGTCTDKESKVDECIRRLTECNATTVALKTSPIALATLWMQNNLLPILPKFLQQKAALDLFQRHTMVFSNVPGPSRSIRFCGERVIGLQAIFANLLPQIIMLSYGGAIFANLVIDTDIISDSKVIEDFYLQEIMLMCEAYKIELPNNSVSDLLAPTCHSSKNGNGIGNGNIGVIDQESIVAASLATLKKMKK